MNPKFAAKDDDVMKTQLIIQGRDDKRDSGTHPTLVEALRWDFLPKGWFSEICMIRNTDKKIQN